MFPILGDSNSSKSFGKKDIENKKWESRSRNLLDDTHPTKKASIAPSLKNHFERKRTRKMIVTPSEAITAVHVKQKTTGDVNTESDLKTNIDRKRTRIMTEISTKADKTSSTNIQTSQDEIKTDKSTLDGRTRSVRERTRTRIETSKEANMATQTKKQNSEDEITLHFTEGKTNKLQKVR